jgi:hypothetical protein
MRSPSQKALSPSQWSGGATAPPLTRIGENGGACTVGIKVGPYAMVDWYGTPHTEALHVVERYRLLDHDAAKDGFERDAKERNVAPGMTNPNPQGKSLQLQFTVDDKGVFTTPWTATMTYGFSSADWAEQAWAENIYWYSGKEADVPRANKPDF